jgi:hypothetical protein
MIRKTFPNECNKLRAHVPYTTKVTSPDNIENPRSRYHIGKSGAASKRLPACGAGQSTACSQPGREQGREGRRGAESYRSPQWPAAQAAARGAAANRRGDRRAAGGSEAKDTAGAQCAISEGARRQRGGAGAHRRDGCEICHYRALCSPVRRGRLMPWIGLSLAAFFVALWVFLAWSVENDERRRRQFLADLFDQTSD